jgi:hypothetical protein
MTPRASLKAPRYETLLCGVCTFDIQGADAISMLVRVAHEATTDRFVIIGREGTYATLDEAKAQAAAGGGRMDWWSSPAGKPGDPVCHLCGAFNGGQMEAPERYPTRICAACVLEAVDATGRSLRFGNTSLGGGFAATYLDTGQPYASHECFVRGVRCRADEAYFGGIVVTVVEQNVRR